MRCQEFSNALTGMCLCWSFRVVIVVTLWCLCTLVFRKSRTFSKITASVGSYRSHKFISELHVISLYKPSIYSKPQSYSMQEHMFCFVYFSIEIQISISCCADKSALDYELSCFSRGCIDFTSLSLWENMPLKSRLFQKLSVYFASL